jgi:hypothetical protein
VAGDVVLYPKYQVLVANQESLARLSDEQRAALDAIVEEVHRLALGRHFTEAELAAGICEIGGTVVEAGPEAVEALKAAATPLSDEMATDPVMGPIIERIRTLAEETPRGPGAGTCGPMAAVAPGASAAAPPVTEVDLSGYTGTELPPSGTYRAEMVREGLAAAGASANFAAINDGIWTWTFEGDTWQAHHNRNNERCSGTAELVDGNVRVMTVVSQGCGMDYDLRWRLDGDDLSLRVADLPWTHTATDFADEQVFIDRTWTRIDEPSSSAAATSTAASYPVSDRTGYRADLPPDGTYRADISPEDLIAKGVSGEWANENSGVFTIAFKEGVYSFHHPASDPCQGTYESVGESVLLRSAPDGCAPTFNILWRPDGDGIAMLLAVPTEDAWPMIDFTNIQAHLEDRVWTRIEGPTPEASDAAVPQGAYRAEITPEELEADGWTRESAVNNAGIVTWTFDGDKGTISSDTEIAPDWTCPFTVAQDGEVVSIHLPAGQCDPAVYSLTFEVDGEQLIPTVVATEPERDLTLMQTYFERPWTKID